MSSPAVEAAEDFAEECREAFYRLAREHAAILPRGYDSQRARQRKHEAIDKILDQYEQHVAVMAYEAEMTA